MPSLWMPSSTCNMAPVCGHCTAWSVVPDARTALSACGALYTPNGARPHNTTHPRGDECGWRKHVIAVRHSMRVWGGPCVCKQQSVCASHVRLRSATGVIGTKRQMCGGGQMPSSGGRHGGRHRLRRCIACTQRTHLLGKACCAQATHKLCVARAAQKLCRPAWSAGTRSARALHAGGSVSVSWVCGGADAGGTHGRACAWARLARWEPLVDARASLHRSAMGGAAGSRCRGVLVEAGRRHAGAVVEAR
jgi:hypothetical protein